MTAVFPGSEDTIHKRADELVLRIVVTFTNVLADNLAFCLRHVVVEIGSMIIFVWNVCLLPSSGVPAAGLATKARFDKA